MTTYCTAIGQCVKYTIALLLFSLNVIMPNGQATAAWYQAQGQALIINGNKEQAKQQATEEAIRQALMFAGASISSSQRLTNGLLEQDALQINATGEVRRIEKVSEHWHNDYLTVTVRADIFPRHNQCMQSTAVKSLVSAPFSIRTPFQLLDGNIQNFNRVVVDALQSTISQNHSAFSLDVIAPYTVKWINQQTQQQSAALGQKYDAQLVILGHIEDISVIRHIPSWNPFQDRADRRFNFRIQLVDSINGATLMDKRYALNAVWQFEMHENVDTGSQKFWQSQFGQAVENTLQTLTQDIAEAINCQPTTGRVLEIANNQISVNLGKVHGLNIGDIVSLYQLQTLVDDRGKHYIQYNLHPERLVVSQVNYNNALMTPSEGGLLGNIQPNDFVTLN